MNPVLFKHIRKQFKLIQTDIAKMLGQTEVSILKKEAKGKTRREYTQKDIGYLTAFYEKKGFIIIHLEHEGFHAVTFPASGGLMNHMRLPLPFLRSLLGLNQKDAATHIGMRLLKLKQVELAKDIMSPDENEGLINLITKCGIGFKENVVNDQKVGTIFIPDTVLEETFNCKDHL